MAVTEKNLERALIIGAGITGPVTAMGLQKAGIDATVYEAYDRTADGVGAFLTVAVNGLAALRVLDIDPEIPGGFDTPRMIIGNGNGRRLAEFTTGQALDRDGGNGARPLVSQTIRRSDLYRALRDEAVRRGIDVQYGKRLESATTRPDGTVIARFDDGTTAEGDLLIGADGLHSATRRIIDPTCPRPRYTGLLNTGGYASGVHVPGEPGVYHMIFGRRAFFGYLIDPAGDIWWFANVPRAQEASATELAAYTEARWRAELEEAFAPDHAPVLDIIRHSSEVVLPWNTHDLPTVPRWHRDRMVLVGDAAHAVSPTSGQGASLAMEDGVILARCLRDIPDVPRALAAYEQARRGRVERIIAQSKRMSDRKAAGFVGRLLRDHVIMPLLSRVVARSGDPMSWIHDYRIEWDTPAEGSADARARAAA